MGSPDASFTPSFQVLSVSRAALVDVWLDRARVV